MTILLITFSHKITHYITGNWHEGDIHNHKHKAYHLQRKVTPIPQQQKCPTTATQHEASQNNKIYLVFYYFFTNFKSSESFLSCLFINNFHCSFRNFFIKNLWTFFHFGIPLFSVNHKMWKERFLQPVLVMLVVWHRRKPTNILTFLKGTML